MQVASINIWYAICTLKSVFILFR